MKETMTNLLTEVIATLKVELKARMALLENRPEYRLEAIRDYLPVIKTLTDCVAKLDGGKE